MTFTFAPAVREQVSLLVALAGASGSGKTKSALRLAQGISPDGKIAFIDTEARRGLHYADQHKFLHLDMRPPFTPARFTEALTAAEKEGVDVVIVDNFSDEYEGEGGICEWAEKILQGGAKSPGNWNVPKTAHKQMMNRIMQMRVSVIFCLRADERIKIDRENGKTVITPLGWMWIAEKRFHYFMTASFVLTPDRPGIPRFDLPHKLQEQHRDFFPEGRVINERAGKALAAWARGGVAPPTRHSSEPRRQQDRKAELFHVAREKARTGSRSFGQWRARLSDAQRDALEEIANELVILTAEADDFPGGDAIKGSGLTMCIACSFHCCASDEFSACGCEHCYDPDCWTDDVDEIDLRRAPPPVPGNDFEPLPIAAQPRAALRIRCVEIA